jgi:hypothetical protein
MKNFLKKYYNYVKLGIETCLFFVEIIILFEFKYKIMKKTSPNPIAIFASGPSLIRDINKNDLNNHEIMSVNKFCNNALFTEYKPKYHVLVDPGFFNMDLSQDNLEQEKEQMIYNLNERTDWSLQLFIPKYYKNSTFIKRITNPNVKIICFNNIPLIGGSKRLKIKLFKMQLGNPIFQNVLICGIFISVQLGCKKIKLLGADHNWIREIVIDDHNRVLLNDKHISEKDNNSISLKNNLGEDLKFAEYIKRFYITLNEYYIINDYAFKQNCEIINTTKNSYIDAFKRSL